MPGHQGSVLFCAAAGPRLGFGHLMRCGVLASEMRVMPQVALRATGSTRRTARNLGWRVHRAVPGVLRSLAPALIIVDDPSPIHARRWVRAAAEQGIPVALIQDLGLPVAGRTRPPLLTPLLTIDASLVRATADLQGPSFAMLDPVVGELRHQRRPRDPKRIVVALGGGVHVRGIGIDVAARIREARPDITIDLAPGFSSASLPSLPDGCRWVDKRLLPYALATATAAIVSGGVTAYEACALGTPLVTLAVVRGQHVTTAALAAREATLDGSADTRADAIRRSVAAVLDLVDRPDRRAELAAAAMQLVDGRGTSRVVAHLRALLLSHPRRGDRHAA